MCPSVSRYTASLRASQEGREAYFEKLADDRGLPNWHAAATWDSSLPSLLMFTRIWLSWIHRVMQTTELLEATERALDSNNTPMKLEVIAKSNGE